MHVSRLFPSQDRRFREKDKTLETKPQLIQISAAWNFREGAPLGRNHYVELEIKKAKPNGASSKLSPVQKPCDRMTEAIVMDGGKRGQVVKVCAIRRAAPTTPTRLLRSKSSGSGRTNVSGSRRRNWRSRLAIVSWLRFSNAFRLH